jgi:hypothetical protein
VTYDANKKAWMMTNLFERDMAEPNQQQDKDAGTESFAVP